MNTNNTIKVTAYGINQEFDKEELFDYLNEMYLKHYIEYKQAEEDNEPEGYIKIKEVVYLNCIDFVIDIIGEENKEEFVDYCSSIYSTINYQ